MSVSATGYHKNISVCVCNSGSNLNVFSLRLVIKNVGHVLGEDLFSSGTGVDSHHSHTNWPGGITNGHL